MPHKHTRREQVASTYDLPPSQVAKPLPPTTQSKRDDPKKISAKPKTATNGPQKNVKTGKRKRDAAPKDDAPRAFKRLMAYAEGKKPKSGLDNGISSDKKSKKNKEKPEQVTAPEAEVKKATEDLTIRAGERMSEFAARVDAALPLSGLINKSARGGKDPLSLKVYRTAKERKMHKLYDEWREEERKIKEKKEEEMEEAAEKEMEEEETGVSWKFPIEESTSGKKKKKGKRAKYLGEEAGPEEDPWEELKRKRGETRPGLHDVALAPPELNKKLPKKLTVRGAAVNVEGVPKAAGSLRRREELQSVREDVVAQYRKLMEGKQRPKLKQ